MWIPNLGAIFKIGVFVAVIVGAVLYTQEHGMANAITFQSMMPNWNSSAQYIPVIIYGMLGFELVSASSEEMIDPARDVPRSIFVSGFIIIVLYTAATAAMLAALPANDIDLVEGLMKTLNLFFDDGGFGQFFVSILGIATLYTFFSNGVTWSLGCNRAAAEAAQEGELPDFFGIEHKTLAWLCIVVLALSVVLFVYTPGEGVQLPVLCGAFVMIAIGEVLIRWAEKRKQDRSG